MPQIAGATTHNKKDQPIYAQNNLNIDQGKNWLIACPKLRFGNVLIVE